MFFQDAESKKSRRINVKIYSEIYHVPTVCHAILPTLVFPTLSHLTAAVQVLSITITHVKKSVSSVCIAGRRPHQLIQKSM
jgi:uncharacterized membrane protein